LLMEPIPLDGELEFDPAEITKEDFYIAGEIRFNLSVLELSTMILPISFFENDGVYYTEAYLIPGIGLSFELFDLVDLAVTAGPMGYVAASTNGYFETSFQNGLEDHALMVRASADINLGFLSVGGYAIVLSDVTIGDLMDPDFDPGSIDISPYAYVGLAATINLL